jgi:2,3-bisphosphoglycerate-independent phosphoglycerate mutase
MAPDGKPVAVVKDNDAVIFFNFRVDRPRQLTRAFVASNFEKPVAEKDFDPFAAHRIKAPVAPTQVFKREKKLSNLNFVMMTEYGKSLLEDGAKVAYPPEKVVLPLGRVISEAGLRQLRISESEKERFVTYYFNGQQEIKFPGEDRVIIPSSKVSTYDQKPEMSAREVTETLLTKLKSDSDYSFVLVNFANADMVGHTGNLEAAVKACEVLDECIGKLVNFVLAYDGAMIITADHGNAEEMTNLSTGKVDTEHSANPVPFIAISKSLMELSASLQGGILADVAPTILSLLNLTIADTMSGRDLLKIS